MKNCEVVYPKMDQCVFFCNVCYCWINNGMVVYIVYFGGDTAQDRQQSKQRCSQFDVTTDKQFLGEAAELLFEFSNAVCI